MAGLMKATYDLGILYMFLGHKPREEEERGERSERGERERVGDEERVGGGDEDEEL